MGESADALAWVEALREVRTAVSAQLARGTASLAEVIRARTDPRVAELHLLTILESLPGASKVSTRRKLTELGIPGRARLSELTDEQLSAVSGTFGDATASEEPFQHRGREHADGR